MHGDDPILITPLALRPAYITVALGKCCYDLDSASAKCADGVTECECDALPSPNVFFAGEQCVGEPDECEFGACCMLDGSCRDNLTPPQCSTLAGDDTFVGPDSQCLGDSDGDTVDDQCDVCPGENDLADMNNNGIPDCLEPDFIPTISEWGLLVLALLLLTLGKVWFGKRESVGSEQ